MSKTEQDKGSMGHFIGWKFGVPVKAFGPINNWGVEALLVYEDRLTFELLFPGGGCETFAKLHYHYELIEYRLNTYRHRYPICQTPINSAYCNYDGVMASTGATYNDNITRIPDPSIVTLTIGDKVIELSQETADKLRKELGV